MKENEKEYKEKNKSAGKRNVRRKKIMEGRNYEKVKL